MRSICLVNDIFRPEPSGRSLRPGILHPTNPVSLLSVLCVCVVVATQTRAVPLAREGAPAAVIVHHGHIEQAEALNQYIEEITGTRLPMVETSEQAKMDGPRGRIELRLVEKVPGSSDRATAKQAYHIETRGDTLLLTAATTKGLTYCVYGLLEDHLDCRFYTFFGGTHDYGPGHEIVPKRATLALEAINDLQEPAMQMRGFVWYPGSKPWEEKNRGGGLPADAISGTHNFYSIIDPKQYFDEHPEWFPLSREGKRHSSWAMGLCGTDEALARQFAKNLEPVLRKQAPAVPVRVGQGDGFTPCFCDTCRAVVEREETEAAPYLVMLNRVLEIIEDDYPEHQISTFAYFETLTPPKRMQIHPRLWINIVSSDRSQNPAGDHVATIEGSPANRWYEHAIRNWTKLAPGRVTLWHWAHTGSANVEWPNLLHIGQDIAFAHEQGVVGFHPDLHWGRGNWSHLRMWLILKKGWNPQADDEALIKDFLRGHYGEKAAPLLWRYILASTSAWEQSGWVTSGVRWTNWPDTMMTRVFPPRVLERLDGLMDAAAAAAASERNPVYLYHVNEARATTTDVMVIRAAKLRGGFEPVIDPRTGDRWLVPAGDPALPRRIERLVASDETSAAPHHPDRAVMSTFASEGGRLYRVPAGDLVAHVAPHMRGQIYSITHQPTGKHLLAVDDDIFGYHDQIPRVTAQLWYPITRVLPKTRANNRVTAMQGKPWYPGELRDLAPVETVTVGFRVAIPAERVTSSE